MVVQIEARRPRLAAIAGGLAELTDGLRIDRRERHANERLLRWRALVREKAQPTLRRSLALAILGDATILIRPELLPHVVIDVVRVEALPLPALPIVQFSKSTHCDRICCTMLLPAGCPCGDVTSHSPIQKSNRCDSARDWQGRNARSAVATRCWKAASERGDAKAASVRKIEPPLNPAASVLSSQASARSRCPSRACIAAALYIARS